jgi:hypothetical protein
LRNRADKIKPAPFSPDSGDDMKNSAALITFALALIAGGCASSKATKELTESTDKSMASWIGDPVSVLIEVLGPPQQVYEDGRGGRVLVYLEDRTHKVPASSTTSTSANGGVAGNQLYSKAQSYALYTPERMDGYKTFRLFWAGPNGVIYNWAWKGF